MIFFARVQSCIRFLQRFISKLGVDVQKKTDDEETALMLAARGQHSKCVELLLRWRAKVNAITEEGDTALHEAIHERNNDERNSYERNSGDSMDIIKNLIACGAHIEPYPPNYEFETRGNMVFHYSLTPLDLAASYDDSEVTEYLLEAGASPNSGGVRGRYPLVTAAWKGSVSSMKVGTTCSSIDLLLKVRVRAGGQ